MCTYMLVVSLLLVSYYTDLSGSERCPRGNHILSLLLVNFSVCFHEGDMR